MQHHRLTFQSLAKWPLQRLFPESALVPPLFSDRDRATEDALVQVFRCLRSRGSARACRS